MKKALRPFKEDAARPRIETLAVGEISADELLQARERLDPNIISDYMSLIVEDGVEFPPLTVFQDQSRYLLVDGYLRFEAAKLAALPTIRCEVYRGDLRAARLFSTSVNAKHGLPRTWNDKRRAVGKLLGDQEWAKWSDREIARQCCVSHGFVAQERDRLRHVTGNVASEERQFVTKHGTVSTMTIRAPRRLPEENTPPSVPLVAGPTREPPTEIVNLSAFSHDYRAKFIAELRAAEEALDRLPPVTAIRSDRSADAMLAGRLRTLAQKAQGIASLLERRR
jgi:hypothetical protein